MYNKKYMVGIYKITNPKGKIYIGQSTDIENRIYKGHKYNVGSGKKLKNSLSKYGFKNHKIEILEECSIEDLTERETYWILQYNSYKNGLNSTKKGGFEGYRDANWKEKHHEGLKGRKGYWEGKQRPNHSKLLKESGSGLSYKRTQEHKDALSHMMKEVWREKGKEIGEKISQNKMGKGTKSIICIETNEIFNSIKECSEKMNISKGCICSFVKGKYPYPTLKGYTFAYQINFDI
jgi:group I intron endonuclease